MGPVPYGMLVKLDHVPASHATSPDAYDQHSYTPARGIDDIPGFRERLDAFMAGHTMNVRRQEADRAERPLLAKNERKFLDHMALHEYEPLEIVFSYMGNVTAGTQKRILDKLTGCKLIEVKTVRAGRSWVRFGRITEKGWEHLGKSSSYV